MTLKVRLLSYIMNDTLFNEGGITDTAPSLLALISDESGVNATGTGIGHDIIAWIDDDMTGRSGIERVVQCRYRGAHFREPLLPVCNQ